MALEIVGTREFFNQNQTEIKSLIPEKIIQNFVIILFEIIEKIVILSFVNNAVAYCFSSTIEINVGNV